MLDVPSVDIEGGIVPHFYIGSVQDVTFYWVFISLWYVGKLLNLSNVRIVTGPEFTPPNSLLTH